VQITELAHELGKFRKAYPSSSDTDEQSGDDGCVKRYIARGTYLALREPTKRANDLIA
jgi:hypothetical protein